MSAKGQLIIHNRALTGRVPSPEIYARIEAKAKARGHGKGLSKEDKGRALWAELHRWAIVHEAGAVDLVWLGRFRRAIPCGECRQHWDEMIAANPPAWHDLFGWTVARHNEVNRRLGKPEIGPEEALQRWSERPARPVQPTGGEGPENA